MNNTINIDFQIYDSKDPKKFIVLDTSNWGHIQEKPSIIEIILPGEVEPVVHYFNKNAVNIFNSTNLHLSCNDCNDSNIDLPDGIYDITVKGSPDTFNSNLSYLRTTNTQLKLDKLYIKLSLECYKSDNDISKQIHKLNEIELLLKSAEANVRYGEDCIGQELLYKAQKLIDNNQKCNC